MTSAERPGSRRARIPPIRLRISGLLPCIFQLPAISLVRMITFTQSRRGGRFYCVRLWRTKNFAAAIAVTARNDPAAFTLSCLKRADHSGRLGDSIPDGKEYPV